VTSMRPSQSPSRSSTVTASETLLILDGCTSPTCNTGRGEVVVMQGVGDGTFGELRRYEVGRSPARSPSPTRMATVESTSWSRTNAP